MSNFANHLRDNCIVKSDLFSRAGLVVDNVSFCVDEDDDDSLEVFLEVSALPNFEESDDYITVKINFYDKNGQLLCMDDCLLNLEKFGGYDTLSINVFRTNIVKKVDRAVIYAVMS